MATYHDTGPVCQSCGMPLVAKTDCGTDERGNRVSDYCHHCLAAGAFTHPWISLQDMIERSVAIIVEQGIMSRPDARTLMGEIIPKLKRWQEARRGHLTPA